MVRGARDRGRRTGPRRASTPTTGTGRGRRPGRPAGPAAQAARRSVAGPPDVAGLWSSLSAYALVPAGLAGIDVGDVLAGAGHAAALLDTDQDTNPTLLLGALIAAAPTIGLSGAPELADWAVELVARGLRGGGGPAAGPARPARQG